MVERLKAPFPWFGGKSRVAADVWAWAVERGTNPLYRIAVCAYDDGRTLPDGWTRHAWKAHGGYGSQGDKQGRANAEREVIYFSPHCLRSGQASLF
jgi:DNA adenine methylase